MKISYNWLRELTDVHVSAGELAQRLTMLGLAVDAVRPEGDDFILEFDLTSNRPDCLSHLGVAREVAALLQTSLRLPGTAFDRAEGGMGALAGVEIEDTELCPRYAARIVRGVRVGPSPAWLAERLQSIGQRPINNVTDITNFVLHELGQPLHAFDLATLAGSRIIVRRARAGERIRTLDGVERKLGERMLVIADAERPVAIAGVMGGEETEISDATRDVLIESAYFTPAQVRRTSKELGLQTEASYRFERGIDFEGVRRAQDRCVALICELAGGTATADAIDIYPQPVQTPSVSLRPRRVRQLTGLDVAPEESARILSSLGFTRIEPAASSNGSEGESGLFFDVPTWRVDVEIEEDLIEEVARHYGYDNIADELPPSSVGGEYRAGEGRRRAAQRALTALGFDEAINFSFIRETYDALFELLPGVEPDGSSAQANNSVTLTNPIIEGASRMRQTLLPGLLESVRHNFNYGTRDLRLFEMGRIFATRSGHELPDEPEAFAIVMTGGALEEGRATVSREFDFYDLKGALEAASEAMNVGALEYEPARVRHLREGQAARVLLDGQIIGTLGRLSEALSEEFKFRQPVFVAEVSFSALIETQEEPVRYMPLARYPSVVRDVSLITEKRVTFAALRRIVLDLRIEYCRGAELVDVYEGANLPEGKRSVTLRIEYRADDRTLRDEEVDEMHARVLRALEEGSGAQLRT